MAILRSVAGRLFVSVVLVGCSDSRAGALFVPGDGSAPDSGAPRGCPAGEERCSCYGNGTCNAGLTCASGLCVVFSGAGGMSMSIGGSVAGGAGGSSARSGAEHDASAPGDAGSISRGGTGGRSVRVDTSTDAKADVRVPEASVDATPPDAQNDSGDATDDARSGPLAIYIMLDRSASMLQPPPGQTLDSWTNSVNAIAAFVTDPLSRGADVGLGGFPAGAQNTFDCATGADCGMPIVPIASLPNNAQPIINVFAAQRPAGLAFTPTECALRGMINQCLQFMSMSPIGEKCVAVLVTDGTPTQCDLDNENLIKIITDGKAKGVDSYALGLPGSDLVTLNGYAKAGGTGSAIDVSGGTAPFVRALEAIRDR